MAHNLFGDRFLGNRRPAWHGLGKVFEGPMGAVEAVRGAGLDFQIHKLPVFTAVGDNTIQLPGKFVIMREPTHDDPLWRQFGSSTVTEDYAFLQNLEVGELAEPLVEQWPVETVGALGLGETIFFSLSAGTMNVAGEEVQLYFLLTDTRDGGSKMKIALTPVRVVCQNTLVSGLQSSTVTVDVAHRQGMRGRVEMYMNLTKRLNGSVAELQKAFDIMSAAALSPESVQAVFAAAYPAPRKPAKLEAMPLEDFDHELVPELFEEVTQAEATWKYYTLRAQSYRSAADELFGKINDEHPAVAGTAWAAYNAVVECEDYRNGTGAVDASALFGVRAAAKKRAFSAALEYAVVDAVPAKPSKKSKK